MSIDTAKLVCMIEPIFGQKDIEFKSYMPEIKILRDFPGVNFPPSPGVYFYSKNPAVTAEVVRSVLTEQPASEWCSISHIPSVADDFISAAQRDSLLCKNVNNVFYNADAGLILYGSEIAGLPAATFKLHDAILAASLAVWVRKIVKRIHSTSPDITSALDKCFAEIHNRLDYLVYNRYATSMDLVTDAALDLTGKLKHIFSISWTSSTSVCASELRLTFSEVGILSNSELYQTTVEGSKICIPNLASIFDDPEITDTLGSELPTTDFHFPEDDPCQYLGYKTIQPEPPRQVDTVGVNVVNVSDRDSIEANVLKSIQLLQGTPKDKVDVATIQSFLDQIFEYIRVSCNGKVSNTINKALTILYNYLESIE